MNAVLFWLPEASTFRLLPMQQRFHLMIPTADFARVLQNLQKLTGISTVVPQSLTGKIHKNKEDRQKFIPAAHNGSILASYVG